MLAVADEFGDRADRLLQHIVRDAECVGERDLLVGDKFQPVIRNDDQRVDLVGQIRNAHLGLTHPVRTLKFERLRHNADGQNALVMRDLRNDRRRAGARAAAHTGGDEHHIGPVESLGDDVLGFLGGFLADLGLGACAHAAGQLFADLDFIFTLGLVEILLIGVDRDELHAADAAADHAVDDVVACAADADDLDINYLFLKICHLTSSYV